MATTWRVSNLGGTFRGDQIGFTHHHHIMKTLGFDILSQLKPLVVGSIEIKMHHIIISWVIGRPKELGEMTVEGLQVERDGLGVVVGAVK